MLYAQPCYSVEMSPKVRWSLFILKFYIWTIRITESQWLQGTQWLLDAKLSLSKAGTPNPEYSLTCPTHASSTSVPLGWSSLYSKGSSEAGVTKSPCSPLQSGSLGLTPTSPVANGLWVRFFFVLFCFGLGFFWTLCVSVPHLQNKDSGSNYLNGLL